MEELEKGLKELKGFAIVCYLVVGLNHQPKSAHGGTHGPAVYVAEDGPWSCEGSVLQCSRIEGGQRGWSGWVSGGTPS